LTQPLSQAKSVSLSSDTTGKSAGMNNAGVGVVKNINATYGQPM